MTAPAVRCPWCGVSVLVVDLLISGAGKRVGLACGHAYRVRRRPAGGADGAGGAGAADAGAAAVVDTERRGGDMSGGGDVLPLFDGDGGSV